MTTQSTSTLSKYELIVGLEVHVQLATASIFFSNDSANFDAEATDVLQTLIYEVLNQYQDKVKEYKSSKKAS